MRGDIVTGKSNEEALKSPLPCVDMPLFTNKNYGGRCERDGEYCKKCIDMKARENVKRI
jgi:hypothetical protein